MRKSSCPIWLPCVALSAVFACSADDPSRAPAQGGTAGSAASSSSGGSGAASSAGGASADPGGGSAGLGSAGSGGGAADPRDSSAPSNGEVVDAAVRDAVARDGAGDAARNRDGATADAGPTLAGGCGSAKVCDDFEKYALAGSLAPWTTAANGGALKVDVTHAWSGKQSVQVHADPGANRMAQLLRTGAPLFPAQPNLLWGRMMVYATNLPPSTVHYDNIQADGTGQGQYRIGGMGGILLNYQPHDCYQHISPAIPQNKWTCWEWLYDGPRNTIEFYIDGVLQTKVNGTGQGCVDGTTSTWTAPTFSAVRLGWVNYQSMAAAVDLWMDDVALGGERISCPAAGDAPH